VRILGAQILDEVHNHHNFAWLETHDGHEVWVVRKGATPAFPGQRGFVGGSMGDDAVILEGVDPVGNPLAAAENQAAALFSTVHGAGRAMSRTAAKGRRKKVEGRWVADPNHPGAVSRQDMERWIGKRGVVLRGADTDEAPQAYKRLPEVLRHHAGTVNILHTLSPIGVAMAGAGEFDPYKDCFARSRLGVRPSPDPPRGCRLRAGSLALNEATPVRVRPALPKLRGAEAAAGSHKPRETRDRYPATHPPPRPGVAQQQEQRSDMPPAGGASPPPRTNSGVAQLAEHRPYKPAAAGSKPASRIRLARRNSQAGLRSPPSPGSTPGRGATPA